MLTSYSVKGPGHILVYGKCRHNHLPTRQVWKSVTTPISPPPDVHLVWMQHPQRMVFQSSCMDCGPSLSKSSSLRRQSLGIHFFSHSSYSKLSLSTVSEMHVPHRTNARAMALHLHPPGHVVTRVVMRMRTFVHKGNR